MTEGYARASMTGTREPGVVVNIDPQTRTAMVALRSRYEVRVNCAYAVGEAVITPAKGEQWFVERFDMEWRLAGRIPYNDPTLNIEPVPGQVSVGSANGPLELNGTAINFRSPLVLPSYTTAKLPDPEEAGEAATVYDRTTHKILVSDGAVWRDALGTAV